MVNRLSRPSGLDLNHVMPCRNAHPTKRAVIGAFTSLSLDWAGGTRAKRTRRDDEMKDQEFTGMDFSLNKNRCWHVGAVVERSIRWALGVCCDAGLHRP